MKTLIFIPITLLIFALSSCGKQETKIVEKIVTVHDTIINGQVVYVHDTITINNEPTYTTTGIWRYFNYESSTNGGSWETESKNEKWKFTAYRVFVDANNDGVYEREGFFGNFGAYITIYFYDESTVRRYDIISSTNQDLWITRTVGNLQEKLYMQKF
ncbi:MAG: hypothetical protein U0T07_09660 [Chitinophagales bacterium]